MLDKKALWLFKEQYTVVLILWAKQVSIIVNLL